MGKHLDCKTFGLEICRPEYSETENFWDWKTVGLGGLKLVMGKHLDWITVGLELLRLEKLKSGKC